MTFLTISAVALLTIGAAKTARLVITDGLSPIPTRRY